MSEVLEALDRLTIRPDCISASREEREITLEAKETLLKADVLARVKCGEYGLFIGMLEDKDLATEAVAALALCARSTDTREFINARLKANEALKNMAAQYAYNNVEE